MEFLPWGVLFLLAASAPLLGINPGRSSHSLLHTYMKESDQSLFILSTYLDGKRITRYDNKKHSVEVVLPRVQAFLQNDSETNRREIDHAKDAEEYFGLALYHLNKLYNQSSASVRQRFGTTVSVTVMAILLFVTTIYWKCFRQEKQTCPQSPAALSQELLDPRETLPVGETQGAQEDREGRPGDHQFCALCGKRYLSSIKMDRRGFSDKDFCSCPPVTLVEIPSK